MIGYGNSYFISTILDSGTGGNPPINTVAPVISGSTTLGSLLSSTTGTWTGDAPITYSYQWKRNGNDIVGATSNLYTIQVADSGAALTCQVTATNSVGSASATSNTITANTFVAPTNTVAPVLSGTAQEGQTLTTSTGTWTGTPVITYTYQWKRNGNNITSATNSTYTLVTADVGQSIKCTVTATNSVGSASADSNTVVPIAAFDPDAQAFITAASITNPTQQSAINTLVTDFKGYNIWTKFKAIYPIVGGVASSHAVNLKTPGTFNLSFTTGWTHSSTGMTPNGTSAYADTSLIPNSVLSLNSTHISGYIRNNINSPGPILSSENAGSYDNGLYIWPKQSSNLYSIRVNDIISDFATVTYDVRGLHLAIRTASNVKKYRVNTTQIFNSTSASYALNTSSIYIGASRNNANYFSNEIAFSSIGDGLTDTEAANFYTAVNAYQVALSRNI